MTEMSHKNTAHPGACLYPTISIYYCRRSAAGQIGDSYMGTRMMTQSGICGTGWLRAGLSLLALGVGIAPAAHAQDAAPAEEQQVVTNAKGEVVLPPVTITGMRASATMSRAKSTK